MKVKTNYLILAIFLLIIVALAMMISCKSHKNIKLSRDKHSNFENFDNNNLQYGVYGNDKMIDMFGEVKGSLECDESKSFNLSNSMGPLCIKDKHTNDLMRTRGGNASGKPSSIDA